MVTQQPIPQPTFPLVDTSGIINDVWYRFLSSLFARTGGNLGTPSGGTTTPPGYAQLQSAVRDLQTKVPLLAAAQADQDVLSAAELSLMTASGLSAEQIGTLQTAIADLQIQIAYQAEDFA